jgi:aspartate/methionine/tyrosine aminotransferase
MKIKPFALERYFAKYEFSARYLLSSSDCEPLSLSALMELADRPSRQMWEELRLGYTESLGHPLLRAEAARLYHAIHPEEVLIVTPEEGILIAMNVLLERGDHVIAAFPGYQSLYEVAFALGCAVTLWMPQEQAGWQFDLDELKASIRPNTKLIVINFPHNPTGSLVDRQGFTKILTIAGERGIPVFSDEMYRLLEYDPADRLPSASELSENALSLSGLSKSFALAGLRIGWLTTRDKNLYARLAAYKDYTTICSSAPSEVLAIMALRARDAILRRNLEIIQGNLSQLDRFFERHTALFSWKKPKAGTIAFPRLRLPGGAADFCAGLVEKKGVMLLPSTVYQYESGFYGELSENEDYRDNAHFRVGFGRANLPQALEIVEQYLADLGVQG